MQHKATRSNPRCAVNELKLNRQRRGCGNAPQPQSFTEGAIALSGVAVGFHSGLNYTKKFWACRIKFKNPRHSRAAGQLGGFVRYAEIYFCWIPACAGIEAAQHAAHTS